MTRTMAIRYAWVIVAMGLLAACNSQKEPAEQAFAKIEASVGAVRSDLEQYAPEQFADLTAAIDDMKAKLNAKDYAGALAAQGGIMQRLSMTSAAAASNRNAKLRKLTASWRELFARVPPRIEKLGVYVKDLAGKSRLPTGVSKDAVAAAQGALPDLSSAWAAAMMVAAQSNMALAVERGQAVEQRLNQLAAGIGLQF